MAIAQIIGLILMIVGLVSLAVLLYQDIVRRGEPGTLAEGGFDWVKLLGSLPARYLPSVVALLLGWAMFDPTGFGTFIRQASGT